MNWQILLASWREFNEFCHLRHRWIVIRDMFGWIVLLLFSSNLARDNSIPVECLTLIITWHFFFRKWIRNRITHYPCGVNFLSISDIPSKCLLISLHGKHTTIKLLNQCLCLCLLSVNTIQAETACMINFIVFYLLQITTGSDTVWWRSS